MKEIISLISEATGLDPSEVIDNIEEPSNPEFGDYACTIAFELAKKERKSPQTIAKEIVEKIKIGEDSIIKKIEVKGPYINFFLDWSKLSLSVINDILNKKEKYGAFDGKREKVVIEHTSANPNKPLHMGTARCAILGDITARLFKYCNYDVEVQNYIDDLGRQAALTVLGKIKKGDEVPFKKEYKGDYYAGLLYIKGCEIADEYKDEVNKIIKDIEEGKGEIAKIKEELLSQSVRGQLETAWRLNIFYDLLVWERDIVRSGLFSEALKKIMSTGFAKKLESGPDAGCIVVDMKQFENELGEMKKPYKIIVRSDGTATYVGKDIAYHMWKFGLFPFNFKYSKYAVQPNDNVLWSTGGGEEKETFGNAEKIIDVVGFEQKHAMLVSYYAIKSLGFEEQFKNCHHLSFEHVWLPGERFSGRKGNWIGYHVDAVLDKAHKKAYEEILLRNANLSEDEIHKIAEQIAVAAIRFYISKFDLDKKIIFDYDKALDFNGETGPYCQYACLRARKILEKTGYVEYPLKEAKFKNEEEIQLIKELSKFPAIIKRAVEKIVPDKIAKYTYLICSKFNEFYSKCHVLKEEDEEIRNSRIALVMAFKYIVETCLDILGIEVPEVM